MSTVEFSKIMSCETAKQIWDQLELMYEGTNKVKDAKINLLTFEYESFLYKLMKAKVACMQDSLCL